jgi:uncharacterized BrkB/YihY/UPF0761 family membrane protein
VLMPLAVLGSVVVALWPAARQRFGWLVVGVAAVATALVPIATNSGGKLKTRVASGGNAAIDKHEHLGNLMLYWAIPLLVAVAALMVVHEVSRRRQVSWTKLATVAAAVLTIGFAVAAGIHVYRVGDAGSRAVWEFVKDQQPH